MADDLLPGRIKFKVSAATTTEIFSDIEELLEWVANYSGGKAIIQKEEDGTWELVIYNDYVE